MGGSEGVGAVKAAVRLFSAGVFKTPLHDQRCQEGPALNKKIHETAARLGTCLGLRGSVYSHTVLVQCMVILLSIYGWKFLMSQSRL